MSAQLGEGLSRLRVGGTTLSRIARIEKIASTAPAAPSRWPIADLVDDIDTFFTASPNNRRTAPPSISSPSGVEVPCALMQSIAFGRSEERRVGKEGVDPGRCEWTARHIKKQK